MIKPVEKVRILTAHDKIGSLLVNLQRHNIVMLNYSGQTSQSPLNAILNRLEKVISELSKLEKQSLFFSLETSYEQYIKDYQDELNWFDQVEARLFKLEELRDNLNKFKEEEIKLNPFSNVSFKVLANNELDYIYLVSGVINKKDLDKFRFQASEDKINLEIANEFEDLVSVFLWGSKSDQVRIDSLSKSEGFKLVDLSIYENSPKEEVALLNQRKEESSKLLDKLTNEQKSDAKELARLKLLYEKVNNQMILETIDIRKTELTSYIDGWVKKEDVNKLKEVLDDTKISYEFEIIQPEVDEIVPTSVENNKLVKPFESITNIYSIPNNNEVDPNPVTAVWYWLIFGIMMGDVGYGILLLLGGIFLLKIPKLSKGVKDLATVFTYSSIAAIITGVLFGSFFGYGFDLAQMLGLPFKSTVMDTVGQPIDMLILSIAIGFLHIITGLVIKVINSIKQGNYYEMLSQGLSWIFILVGVVMLVLGQQIAAITLIGLGIVLILLFNGYQNKSIVGKAFGGLTGLFGVTGYLSDILSYSRILALALSSAVIAFTMNMLAEMVMGGGIGILLGAIVYIIGHIFNLAISLLSTYVHDGRLQYIEFFGKFYEGEGVLFQPLAIQLNYYQEINTK